MAEATTIPSHIPPATPATPPPDPAAPPKEGEDRLMSSVIPEEFRDRPYLKDIGAMKFGHDALNEIFKKLDGAQKLVGTKTGIPAADAPDTEWEQFYAKMRPEKPEGYEIKVAEGVDPNPEYLKRVRGIFHDAGLTPKQAASIQAGFGTLGTEQGAAAKAEAEKRDTEFNALTEATFGADNEAKLAQAKKMMVDHVPEGLKDHVGKLSNEALVILAGVLNQVHEKYGLEDRIDSDGAPASVGDINSLREKGRELMASKEWRDPFHPKHDEVKGKVDQIYADIAAMEGRQNKKK